jgi:calcium/proton exchanger cax
MCFFVGGLRRSEQAYNTLVAQTSASMMTVSVASLLIPAAFHATFPGEDQDDANTLKISRASSIILLLVYFSYAYAKFSMTYQQLLIFSIKNTFTFI